MKHKLPHATFARPGARLPPIMIADVAGAINQSAPIILAVHMSVQAPEARACRSCSHSRAAPAAAAHLRAMLCFHLKERRNELGRLSGTTGAALRICTAIQPTANESRMHLGFQVLTFRATCTCAVWGFRPSYPSQAARVLVNICGTRRYISFTTSLISVYLIMLSASQRCIYINVGAIGSARFICWKARWIRRTASQPELYNSKQSICRSTVMTTCKLRRSMWFIRGTTASSREAAMLRPDWTTTCRDSTGRRSRKRSETPYAIVVGPCSHLPTEQRSLPSPCSMADS
jgi:hypothetical protein